MQFSRERPQQNAIVRYDARNVWINGHCHTGSLAVCAEHLLTDWQCARVADIDSKTLTPLVERQPEVIILAVGDTVQFPRGEVLRAIMQQGIGIEVMNDGAAVRTFNIMLSEQRDVLLGLVR